ncbi:hypothetical protein JCM18899A_45700 [Nocardioides sp. AN3]
MSVDITVLGGFSVVIAGVRVPDRAWRRRAASSVVKLLALSEGRALHREQVADLLWPELPVSSALPRLHQAAHYARSALGRRDGVVMRHDRVTLLPDADVRVDAVEFQQRAEQALSTGSPQEATEVLADHPGDLLPEDLYAEWTAPHRETLAALRDRLDALAGPASAPAGAPDRGRSRGLLLVIDDLAGADAASLRMLHHVAASITARGIGRVVEL